MNKKFFLLLFTLFLFFTFPMVRADTIENAEIRVSIQETGEATFKIDLLLKREGSGCRNSMYITTPGYIQQTDTILGFPQHIFQKNLIIRMSELQL